ncbi:MAG: hypothetical protein ACOYXM_01415 [Actinomycetota bacterium]
MTEEQKSPNGKSPVEAAVEHAVEALVYAPIGILFEGASLLPQLVEKGRSQVAMARMIGKFAVEQGRTEATKAAGKLQDQAAGVLEFIGGGVTPGPSDPTPQPRAKQPARKPAAKPRAAGAARQAARQVTGAASARTDGGGPDSAALAIPDYDGLSASHVVNRLAGLSAAELEAVRQYEAANRGRKTILSKVAQLQSS